MSHDTERYQKARQRVQEIKGFFVHLMVYIIVNLGLLMLNLFLSPDGLWFFWPLIGWGIGLAAHALQTFGLGRWLSTDWEERTIRKIMEQE